MNTPKRILICPLDWGLGHASRCIPLIRLLISAGYDVIIAADKAPLDVLSKEFPTLQKVRFPAYNIRYKYTMIVNMLLALPKILYGMYTEHARLKKIIAEYKIDLVISDNRFGLWNKSVPTVFITHQIMIKCPDYLKFLEPFIYKVNLSILTKYNQCWIPDFENTSNNLSGDLSHAFPLPENAFFIQPLSRFFNADVPNTEIENFDLLVILSGPEPQRSIFENIIIEQLESLKNLKTLIIRGLPSGEKYPSTFSHIKMFQHLDTDLFYRYLHAAPLVLCRSGYSSIMDISALGKRAIFVPTPGQTEQEYLAQELDKQLKVYSVSQSAFNLETALEKCKLYSGLPQVKTNENYKIILEKVHGLLQSGYK